MKIHHLPKNTKDFSVYISHRDCPTLHMHTYWEIFLLTQGKSAHTINDTIVTMKPHDLCIVRPSDTHAIQNDSHQDNVHMALRISCEYIEKFFSAVDPNFYQKLIHSKTPLHFSLKNSTSNRIVDSVYKVLTSSVNNYESFCRVLFLDIFRAIYYQSIKIETFPTSSYSKVVLDLMYLIGNPKNLKKDIATLVSELNYSYSHVNRVFTAEIGISPSKYLKQQRFHYAQKLLTETDLSMEDIANEIGFSTYAHFLVAFKKELNISPTEYRKNQDNYLLNITTL